MTESEIKEIFERVYNGATNFMTPYVERYGKRGKVIYELSSGSGFNCERIYGVTVLSLDGEKQPTLSKGGFTKLSEAEQYIKELGWGK